MWYFILVLLCFLNTEFWNQKNAWLERTQNHKIVRVGWELWRASNPTPCQGSITSSKEDIQMGFKCLQRGRLHNSLFQCSGIIAVEFFLMLRWNFLCFSLWSLLLLLSLDNAENSVAPLTFEIFICIDTYKYFTAFSSPH